MSFLIYIDNLPYQYLYKKIFEMHTFDKDKEHL